MVDDLEVDVVVAGGGVSGLMCAYRAQQAGARILLMTGSGGASSRISSLNTALDDADPDTSAGLFNDMLRAGGYVNNPELVAVLTARIGNDVRDLADLGVPFVAAGELLARRQATGSSWTRSVYSRGMIGVDISRRVLAEIEACAGPTATIVRGGALSHLHVSDGRVGGALVYSQRERRRLRVAAPAVVLATGGAGQLFGTTTNPRGSRAAGFALALQAGAELVDMEFVSFEPFVTSGSAETRGQNLPTTVLRAGAVLRNGAGEEFLDTSAGPTKDIICRAMVREVIEGRGTDSDSVYFDLRKVPPDVVEQSPHLVKALSGPPSPLGPMVLEVMPAQHFMDGGVRIDATTATTVPGLFAVGEVSGGAHGANRLAGAGGLEAVAGGSIAGESAARYALADGRRPRDASPVAAAEMAPGGGTDTPADTRLLNQVRLALDSGCGILRTETSLAASVATITDVLAHTPQTWNQVWRHRGALVALAIARSALLREESRGDHFRLDFPRRDDVRWLGNTTATLAGEAEGDVDVRFERAGLAQRGPAQPDARRDSRSNYVND
jgi:succinate dehydrogenase/fumarate reductase flavoprotein subunit